MPRIPRIIAVGFPHHVTQRGNNRHDLFYEDSDFIHYAFLVEKYCKKYSLSIISYCLMKNHVHFIVIPYNEQSMARTFSVSHMRYAQFFNKKMDCSGHLWQGRFYSCILDESHLISAVRYVERNPVRAGISGKPWEWRWSSARHHVGEGCSIITINDFLPLANMSHEQWRCFVDGDDELVSDEKIKGHTVSGRPFMSKSILLSSLEKMNDIKLAIPSRGRPRKQGGEK
jgi:putative transposase